MDVFVIIMGECAPEKCVFAHICSSISFLPHVSGHRLGVGPDGSSSILLLNIFAYPVLIQPLIVLSALKYSTYSLWGMQQNDLKCNYTPYLPIDLVIM